MEMDPVVRELPVHLTEQTGRDLYVYQAFYDCVLCIEWGFN